MIYRLLMLALAAGLAACATPQRQGPPAPVVSASVPKPEPAPVVAAPVPKPAGPKPVQLYAYKPPSEAAKIAELPPAVEAEAGAEAEGPAEGEAETQAPKTAPATQSVQAPQPKAQPSAPPAPEVVAAATPAMQATPVDALRGQSDQQRQAGDYAGAAATLERALRLKPQDAQLWNRLARVRMDQGLHSQAANLAARSNALAGDQAALKQDNWSIIAGARRQAGDAAGAADAERRARGA
jgi:Flp pilus assembly protein TadD